MTEFARAHVVVIGAGPAGLMAADVLAQAGAPVTVYDRMPSVGRKLLMAGRGGLNLTHSEDLSTFLMRYGVAMPRLRDAIEAFSPTALRSWCEALGQETFVGSSGRVFPRLLKASPLLRAWLNRLATAGVQFKMRHHWNGWDERGRLVFSAPQGAAIAQADAIVLALGGASWPRLGSDGAWVRPLADAGVGVAPLKPANCGFIVPWSEMFRGRFEGLPLKRIELRFEGHVSRGEVMITRVGIEGGGIYALSTALRDAIDVNGEAILRVALRPELTAAELAKRLALPRSKQSMSTFLRKSVGLSSVAIGILQEAAAASTTKLPQLSPDALARLINSVPIRLTACAPIARAISTAGGVRFDEVDANFMLTRRPGTFVAGEMLDWEAPTGGYLLQATLATGAAAGRGVLKWLARTHAS